MWRLRGSNNTGKSGRGRQGDGDRKRVRHELPRRETRSGDVSKARIARVVIIHPHCGWMISNLSTRTITRLLTIYLRPRGASRSQETQVGALRWHGASGAWRSIVGGRPRCNREDSGVYNLARFTRRKGPVIYKWALKQDEGADRRGDEGMGQERRER